jgi:hypothetical protein
LVVDPAIRMLHCSANRVSHVGSAIPRRDLTMAARAKRAKPAPSEASETEAIPPTIEAQHSVPAAPVTEPGPAAEVADRAVAAVEDEDEGQPPEKTGVPATASIAVAADTSGEGAQELLDATRSVFGVWLHWWPEQLADNARTAQALAGCRSVADMVEIQRAYVGSAIERWNRLVA